MRADGSWWRPASPVTNWLRRRWSASSCATCTSGAGRRWTRRPSARPETRRAVWRRDRPWLVLGVVCAGFFVTLLDTSIVNVAVPRLRQDLGAGLDQVLWVVNAYLLA